MGLETTFIDASRLIIESLARAGADVFIGYPITPANLLYLNASTRIPLVIPAPDEITTLQWMSGFSAAGKFPMTATSFPGFALMLESINMAYMMELPMVIILAQRLGPATGSATCGAQGDLKLVQGMISGGYPLPTFCISNFDDAWKIAYEAARAALELRTPVVLLTSKEMVMTLSDFDLGSLEDLPKIQRKYYDGQAPYLPYRACNDGVAPFLPLGNDKHQVRMTASTHDTKGNLQHATKEALDNTLRLYNKCRQNLPRFTFYELDEDGGDNLLISYDITSQAAREAVRNLRADGRKLALLIAKTLFPVPDEYIEIANRYKHIAVAEENYLGDWREILFGQVGKKKITGINGIGKMISPSDIVGGIAGFYGI